MAAPADVADPESSKSYEWWALDRVLAIVKEHIILKLAYIWGVMIGYTLNATVAQGFLPLVDILPHAVIALTAATINITLIVFRTQWTPDVLAWQGFLACASVSIPGTLIGVSSHSVTAAAHPTMFVAGVTTISRAFFGSGVDAKRIKYLWSAPLLYVIVSVCVLQQQDYTVRVVLNNALTMAIMVLLVMWTSAEQEAIWQAHRKLVKQTREVDEQNSAVLSLLLPPSIITQTKTSGLDLRFADRFDHVSIMFLEICQTPEVLALPPTERLHLLNECFLLFDNAVAEIGLLKVETISSIYMACGGAPEPMPGHAIAIGQLALRCIDAAASVLLPSGDAVSCKVGLNCGPVVAGVIGKYLPRYRLFGDTVNTCARMETNSLPGRITVTEAFKAAIDRGDVDSGVVFEPRGTVFAKGKGDVVCFFLNRGGGGDNAANGDGDGESSLGSNRSSRRGGKRPAFEPVDAPLPASARSLRVRLPASIVDDLLLSPAAVIAPPVTNPTESPTSSVPRLSRPPSLPRVNRLALPTPGGAAVVRGSESVVGLIRGSSEAVASFVGGSTPGGRLRDSAPGAAARFDLEAAGARYQRERYAALYQPARAMGALEPLAILATGIWLTFSSPMATTAAARPGVWPVGCAFAVVLGVIALANLSLWIRGRRDTSSREMPAGRSPAAMGVLNSLVPIITSGILTHWCRLTGTTMHESALVTLHITVLGGFLLSALLPAESYRLAAIIYAHHFIVVCVVGSMPLSSSSWAMTASVPLIDTGSLWYVEVLIVAFVAILPAVAMTNRQSQGLERLRREDFVESLRAKHQADATLRLVSNFLPPVVTQHIRSAAARGRDQLLAWSFEEACILQSDICGFTSLGSRITPSELCSLLHDMFTQFDELCEELGCLKIETVGDAFIACVGVIPDPSPEQQPQEPAKRGLRKFSSPTAAVAPEPAAAPDPVLSASGNGHRSLKPQASVIMRPPSAAVRAERAARLLQLAVAMQDACLRFVAADGSRITMRIGLNAGPIVAGIAGGSMLRFHVFGPTVDAVTPLESSCAEGRVHLSAAFAAALGASEPIPDGLLEPAAPLNGLPTWHVVVGE